jgi:hypothetical protein
MNAAMTKAREASVASAKAKSHAEMAFRNLVIDNNKTCSACRLGKEKIAKRRLEIDGAIKQETKLKAQREAEKRRQSKGRGGRTETAATASLSQESAPISAPVYQPRTAVVQKEPIPAAEETHRETGKRANTKRTQQRRPAREAPTAEASGSGSESNGEASN